MKHSYGNAGCPSHGVRRLFGRFQRRRAAPDALELQVKLEQSEELRIGLRRELNTVQAEISTLRAKLRPRKEILADLLQKTNEDLRAGLRYQVRPSTQSGQWETVTQWVRPLLAGVKAAVSGLPEASKPESAAPVVSELPETEPSESELQTAAAAISDPTESANLESVPSAEAVSETPPVKESQAELARKALKAAKAARKRKRR